MLMDQQLKGENFTITEVPPTSSQTQIINETISTMLEKQSKIIKNLQIQKSKPSELNQEILFTYGLQIMDLIGKKEPEFRIKAQLIYDSIFNTLEEKNVKFIERYNIRHGRYPCILLPLEDQHPLKQWLNDSHDDALAQWLQEKNLLNLKKIQSKDFEIPEKFRLTIKRDLFENDEFLMKMIEEPIKHSLNKIGKIIADVSIPKNDKVNKIKEKIFVLKIKLENFIIIPPVTCKDEKFSRMYSNLFNSNPLFTMIIKIITNSFINEKLLEIIVEDLIKKIKLFKRPRKKIKQD